MKLSLNKSQRIKKRDDIKKLFSSANSLFEYPFKAYYFIEAREEEKAGLKFGISVPKRKFKKAVDRNLIKRRSKEAFRLHQTDLGRALIARGETLWIMPVYIADELLDYQEIEAKIILILQRLLQSYEQDSK